MFSKLTGLCLTVCASGAAQAAITSLDLSTYQLTGHYNLPSVASEASAVAWNADTGTLFVLGDEGDALVEVSTTGSLISTMR